MRQVIRCKGLPAPCAPEELVIVRLDGSKVETKIGVVLVQL